MPHRAGSAPGPFVEARLLSEYRLLPIRMQKDSVLPGQNCPSCAVSGRPSVRDKVSMVADWYHVETWVFQWVQLDVKAAFRNSVEHDRAGEVLYSRTSPLICPGYVRRGMTIYCRCATPARLPTPMLSYLVPLAGLPGSLSISRSEPPAYGACPGEHYGTQRDRHNATCMTANLWSAGPAGSSVIPGKQRGEQTIASGCVCLQCSRLTARWERIARDSPRGSWWRFPALPVPTSCRTTMIAHLPGPTAESYWLIMRDGPILKASNWRRGACASSHNMLCCASLCAMLQPSLRDCCRAVVSCGRLWECACSH